VGKRERRMLRPETWRMWKTLRMRPPLTGIPVVRSVIHWLNMQLRWMRCIGKGLVHRTLMTTGSGTSWTTKLLIAALRNFPDLLHAWEEQKRFGCLMKS